MTYKTNHARAFQHFLPSFRCPYCSSPLKMNSVQSLICPSRHTFDMAKQGYVNFMTRRSAQPYNKHLFEARHHIISEAKLYTSMHQQISNVIQHHLPTVHSTCLMLDACCGEGSHVQEITDMCSNATIQGIGIDISKEAVMMAAKKYKNPLWIVGDLARPPFANQAFHIILNILSPSNYGQFQRILAPNGLVIKVVPRSGYLQQLREALFEDNSRKVYTNEKVVSRFKEQFDLLELIPLQDTRTLTEAERIHLANMSPLAWNADQARQTAFIERETDITIDLDILIGRSRACL